MLTTAANLDAAGPSPVWIDLLSANEDERGRAEALVGMALPTREALSEIETSSRVREREGALFLSVPAIAGPPREATAGVLGQTTPADAPVGFVLTPERLVTVRFMALPSFDAVAARLAEQGGAHCGLEVFVGLCEEMVDHIADGMETVTRELAAVSSTAFRIEPAASGREVRSNKLLLVQLRDLGRLGDRLSAMSEALLGLARILGYAARRTEAWSEGAFNGRMASLIADITSLSDYQSRLSDKVQFLLDATVGLISIAQNEIFKVLTIVSIVGIPPTLVASLYGMNFKNMPELSWSFGYPYGLAMIVLSAVVPVVWFKFRGWF